MSVSRSATMISKWVTFILLIALTGPAYAQHDMPMSNSPLTKSGNDIFGTIQEVITKLEANPNTDWSKVDLEALRQHLLDMKAFTEEVEVLSKESIPKGVEITIQPTSERAVSALKSLFQMHPGMIKGETGWTMDAQQDQEEWLITCTTENEAEVEKIRALGYIGLIAEGSHHQVHHWMVATGHMHME